MVAPRPIFGQGGVALLGLLAAVACGHDNNGPAETHHEIFATTLVGGRPFGVAVSGAGVVLVTQLDSATVSRLNLSGVRSGSVAVGTVPTDVTFSPDGNTAYDTDQHDFTVTRIAVSTGSTSSPLNFPSNTFRVKALGTRLFVTDNANELQILNASMGGWTHRVTVGSFPNGLAFSPDGAKVYVGSFFGQSVSVVSLSAFAVTGTFVVGGNPQDVAITPSGKQLYIANESASPQVWSTETGSMIATIAIPGDAVTFGLAVAPDGEHAWVSAPHAGKVYVISTSSHAVVDSIETGGIPRRIAFSADGKVAVIANEGGWVDFVH